MPNYDYKCDNCDHAFEAFKSFDDREKPCSEPCPTCLMEGVKKVIGGFPSIAADSTLTPDKKTGGQWSEMMNKIKDGTPEKYHSGLDKSTNMNGKRWYG
jgi:putative FmdB family regulatory protein